MTQAVREALRGLPFVEGMESHHIDKLASLATEVGFEKDQIIFRGGESHNQFYLVLFGKVSLEITAPGRVIRVQTVGEGDELGWSFMLTEPGKHFQARALQLVRTLAFEGDRLQETCREDTAFGHELMSRVLRVVSSRLQATRLRILDIYAPELGQPVA
jgi:CRP-like cAMP-binding protein